MRDLEGASSSRIAASTKFIDPNSSERCSDPATGPEPDYMSYDDPILKVAIVQKDRPGSPINSQYRLYGFDWIKFIRSPPLEQ